MKEQAIFFVNLWCNEMSSSSRELITADVITLKMFNDWLTDTLREANERTGYAHIITNCKIIR